MTTTMLMNAKIRPKPYDGDNYAAQIWQLAPLGSFIISGAVSFPELSQPAWLGPPRLTGRSLAIKSEIFEHTC